MLTLGDTEFLKLHKTAFLCSRNISASSILKCYDWATNQRDAGVCVISGFHSQIEKDVLHFLLKGKQPIIMVLARCMKQKLEPEIQKAIDDNRLLIISPFNEKTKRVSEKTSEIRNQLMIELADIVIIGYMKEGGNIQKLIKKTNKEIKEL